MSIRTKFVYFWEIFLKTWMNDEIKNMNQYSQIAPDLIVSESEIYENGHLTILNA